MSAPCRSWIVAASIGVVETLKDQGICRWNNSLRSLIQRTKKDIRAYSQTKQLYASSSSAISNKINRSPDEKMRKVLDLNCWGPNTIRF